MTEPGDEPGRSRSGSMTALIVVTIVVVVFAALVAVYMYGLQGIGT